MGIMTIARFIFTEKRIHTNSVLLIVLCSLLILAPMLPTATAKIPFLGKKSAKVVTPTIPTNTTTTLQDPVEAAQTAGVQPATTVPVTATTNTTLPITVAPTTVAKTVAQDYCFKLPEVLLNTLLVLDKNVKLRTDCYALLSNGESYLPILPQKLEVSPPTQVVNQWRGENTPKAGFPDLIQFDNDWYLIKLTPTDTGKITLARLQNYPTSLKAGVIPQNWFVPAGLSIPAELRVLLGNLDYTTPAPISPEGKPVTRPNTTTGLETTSTLPASLPANATGQKPSLITLPRLQLQPTFFYTDFLSATLQGLDLRTSENKLDLKLGTLAASLLAVPVGDGLWVASVNQPEVLVVNPLARLISTRLELPAPASRLVLSRWDNRVVATHRNKPVLTLMDGKNRLFLGRIALPKPVSTAVMRTRFPIGYFVTVEDSSIYEVDVAKGKLIRTLKPTEKTNKRPQISSIVSDATPTRKTSTPYLKKIDELWLNEPAKGLGQLWLMDKQAQQLQIVQVFTGAVLKTIMLADKPLGWVDIGNNQLAVLTEDKNSLYVFNTTTFEPTNPILLAPTTQMPFTLTTNSAKTQLVVFDGVASQLQVFNLKKPLNDPDIPPQLVAVTGRSKHGVFYEPSVVGLGLNEAEPPDSLTTTATLSDEVKAELAALQALNTQPQHLKRLERLWAKWQSGSRGLH
jgi:hypothetical protein